MRFGSNLVRHPIQVVGLLSAAALLSCSGAPISTSSEIASPDMASPAADQAVAESPAGDRSSSLPTSNFQTTSKLIKHATLQLEMADVEAAIASVSTILSQYQGDLLQLSDLDEQDYAPRQIDVQLRVPQANLESALAALKALGEVTHQSIAAEDVASQLVDLQARVRNLRKSEESLLEIMERSGSIADVLEVNRELSTIREAIERNEAQLKNLQTQVAYSTIALTLTSTQPTVPTASPISETLGETWQTASASMQALSVGLLQLALWLLVFSPYIGILVLGGWLGQRCWQRQRSPKPLARPNEA